MGISNLRNPNYSWFKELRRPKRASAGQAVLCYNMQKLDMDKKENARALIYRTGDMAHFLPHDMGAAAKEGI